MNKSAVKTYAVWARNKLIADIVTKAGLMGITEDGIADALPQSTKNVKFYDIGTKDYASLTGDQIRQRAAFVSAIRAKERESDYKSAFQFVVEKIAYTWFNRLIAIRFMEVNDYLPSHIRVLSSENSNKAEPDMVTKPFDTDLTFTSEEQDYVLKLKDENRLDELFRWLFIKQCHKLNEILPLLFEPESNYARDTDYLDLLLTISFTDKDGVVWRLVHDIKEQDFRVRTPEDDERQKVEQIPEEDMPAGQVQIIGWLYQYYNSEPKDKVFADLKKNIKISKDKIPAATQLFTPDWIVRYMVENSLGRLWVEGHPNEELKQNWKYYLEEAEQEPDVQAQLAEIRKGYAALRPEEIKVIDPCMGSGHILVYLFDVLMQIYQSQGWQAREAAASIVQNNLWGLDIDERAAQLAYFSVMMKARQYDRRFFSRGIQPHVYAIPESYALPKERLERLGPDRTIAETLINDFRDGKEFGSILTPHVSLAELDALRNRLDQIDEMSDYGSLVETVVAFEISACLRPLIDVAQTLTQKYDVVVTNPPYMGRKGMGTRLSNYLDVNYPSGKMDTFATFILRCRNATKPAGSYSLMTPFVWTTLSSYEALRNEILDTCAITSYLQPEENSFKDAAVSICAFTALKLRGCNYTGKYIKLSEYPDIDEQYREVEDIASGIATDHLYTSQMTKYYQFPGRKFLYWASNRVVDIFSTMPELGSVCLTKQGMATTNNDLFLRLWFEVELSNIGYGCTSQETALQSGKKWFPFNKGGGFRKWYGNNEYLVNFENNGKTICDYIDNTPGARVKSNGRVINRQYYFLPCITWSDICGRTFAARDCDVGFIFSIKGASGFTTDHLHYYVLGLLNSYVSVNVLNMINPSITTNVGDVKQIPFALGDNGKIARAKEKAKQNVVLCRNDWDSFETSWDFQKHPLI